MKLNTLDPPKRSWKRFRLMIGFLAAFTWGTLADRLYVRYVTPPVPEVSLSLTSTGDLPEPGLRLGMAIAASLQGGSEAQHLAAVAEQGPLLATTFAAGDWLAVYLHRSDVDPEFSRLRIALLKANAPGLEDAILRMAEAVGQCYVGYACEPQIPPAPTQDDTFDTARKPSASR